MKYAGWTWFNEPNVLKFLQEEGYVYTVRKATKKEGWGYATQGRELLFKIEVKRVSEEISYTELFRFVEGSGFRSAGEWARAIKRQHGHRTSKLAIFRVDISENTGAKENMRPRIFMENLVETMNDPESLFYEDRDPLINTKSINIADNTIILRKAKV